VLIEFDWTDDLSVYEVDPSKGKGRKITGTPIPNPQVAADISLLGRLSPCSCPRSIASASCRSMVEGTIATT
jgi:hypothetical protein